MAGCLYRLPGGAGSRLCAVHRPAPARLLYGRHSVFPFWQRTDILGRLRLWPRGRYGPVLPAPIPKRSSAGEPAISHRLSRLLPAACRLPHPLSSVLRGSLRRLPSALPDEGLLALGALW